MAGEDSSGAVPGEGLGLVKMNLAPPTTDPTAQQLSSPKHATPSRSTPLGRDDTAVHPLPCCHPSISSW